VFAAANDSISVNLNFVGNAKGDNFVADANDKPWEIFDIAVGPFEIDVFECAVFTSGTHIFFDCSKRSTHCAVDAMARDDDASFKPEALAQSSLPKTYCFRIVDGGKRVEKDDFGGIDRENVSGLRARNGE
jgi:hypothetical protein